jgi:hypothetical protein
VFGPEAGALEQAVAALPELPPPIVALVHDGLSVIESGRESGGYARRVHPGSRMQEIETERGW